MAVTPGLASIRVALSVDPELPVPPRFYGGIERIVDMLAQGLVERGHSVTLFAHRHSTCPVPRVAWTGVRSRAAIDTMRNAAILARHVAIGKFDIVHSFSRLAYLAPILSFSIPKLMSYQRAISPKTTDFAYRLARGTLEFSAISQQMMQCASLSGPWHLVPNGVPLKTYSFRPAVAPDAPLVFLGRIEEIKGPHIAIEIAKRAGRRLVIAGNIPDEKRAWATTHVMAHVDDDRVKYVGPVDDKQKNKILGVAVGLLMPILWDEPFGIVMAEAMACGTPVLGLHRGAVPEVVQHGVTGFVGRDIDSLVEWAGRLPTVDRAECRARVEKLYSDRAVVSAYESLYRNLIAQRRP